MCRRADVLAARGIRRMIRCMPSVRLGTLSAVKPSERYRQDAELMLTFRNAYVDLVNHARPTGGSYFLPELGPAVDQRTWQSKRAAVAAAAGVAVVAYCRYGGTFTLRNAAYIMNNVDPVTNWEMSLRDPEQLPPQVVVTSVESAIARAKQEAEDAARRERGLTGLIAAFLRWPSSLREAVGPGHSAQRTAAGAIGIVGQVIVGALATALATGLVAAVVAGWRAVF
jgi:hypothetical protein